MAECANTLGVGAAQHIDHMLDAKPLVDPIDTGQRLLCLHGRIETFRRVGADIAVAAVLRQGIPEVTEQDPPTTGNGLGQRDHRVQFVQLDALLLRILVGINQSTRSDHVLGTVQQQRIGGQAVAPCPPRLLVVTLDVPRQVVVHHETHVGFVDAHPEGHGGHDDLQLVFQEPLLHPLALPGGQAGMVSGGTYALTAQPVRHLFDPFARQRVDDAGLGPMTFEKAQQLLERLVFLQHLVTDVRPVETGHVSCSLAQFQDTDDVVPGLGVRGRRQRDQGHIGETCTQAAQCGILGAEIVSPL